VEKSKVSVVFKSLLFRCYVTTVSQRRDTGYAEESIIIRVSGRETFSSNDPAEGALPENCR